MKALIFSLLFAFVAFIQSQEPKTDVEGSAACKTHFTLSFFLYFNIAVLTNVVFLVVLTCFNGTGSNVSEIVCDFGQTVTS